MIVDPDPFRGDTLSHVAAHLAGPLAGGVRQSPIPLDDHGVGRITDITRHPLLLVVLTTALDAADERVITVTIESGSPVEVRFAPYSERGAALALPIAAADPPITVTVAPHADVELRLVDGVLGRLIYVAAAEKTRLRRTAREIAGGQRLTAAGGDGLDRLGFELRVPRFVAELSWSQAQGEIVATPGREPDASYRRRLALYRPQVRPTRAELDAALPRLLADVGYTGTLAVTESDTELAIAIRLVSPPDDTRRLTHLDYLRRQFLLPVDATELPANRLVSVAERTRTRDLLARLKTETAWPAGAYVAPAIAAALDRVARCAAALGAAMPIRVTRAQDDAGGSRYELGIGVDMHRFDSATIQAMAAALRAGTLTGSPDAETRLLLSSMRPGTVADDPAARWLLRACGLRTAHITSDDTVFISHVPIHGAVLDVAATAGALALGAALRAEGEAAVDANLANALTGAVDASWSLAPLNSVDGATVPPTAAMPLFASVQLTTPNTADAMAPLVAAIKSLPSELIAVLRASASVSTSILGGTTAGGAALQAIVARLRANGAVSILPLVAGGAVLLVVGMTDLPANATVFNRRRAQFRWLTAPVEADQRIGTLDAALGARNRYLFAGDANASQVAAIVAVTPTRPEPRDLHRRVDPFTVVVDRADDSQPLFSFVQYEYLMNLLDRWCPLGVTIDTSRLRAHGVDVDGDGTADLLSLRLQRTFRPFRGRRTFGVRS